MNGKIEWKSGEWKNIMEMVEMVYRLQWMAFLGFRRYTRRLIVIKRESMASLIHDTIFNSYNIIRT